jgi:hypothetical protein
MALRGAHRKYSHTAWLIISAGKECRLQQFCASRAIMGVITTRRASDQCPRAERGPADRGAATLHAADTLIRMWPERWCTVDYAKEGGPLRRCMRVRHA